MYPYHHPKCDKQLDKACSGGDKCVNYAIARLNRKSAVAKRRRVRGRQ